MWLDSSYNQDIKHFIPLNDNQETKFLPDLFFEGKVVTGDNKELEN
jgi:hypothetical protein